jgi:hypothetical protein
MTPMSELQKVAALVRPSVAIGTALVLATVAYATLRTDVQELRAYKADRAEVENLRQSLQRVDERTQRIEAQLGRLICAERPQDLGCRP